MSYVAVGRPGQSQDIAAARAFVISEDASYIPGQIIAVNGGRHVSVDPTSGCPSRTSYETRK